MMNKSNHNQEIDSKVAEYSDRIRFWSSQSIAQLSFSINFFVTLGVGFLAFLVSKTVDISLSGFYLFLYSISIFLVVLSIVLGCISTLSRLKDLRLTRYILLIRKRVAKKVHLFLPDNSSQARFAFSVISGICALIRKNEFITSVDLENPAELQRKFESLRTVSKQLGIVTWKTHKIQVISFAIAMFFYVVSFLSR